MADRAHRYAVTIRWTGDRGTGTRTYRGYDRDHAIAAEGKPPIAGSADLAFLGDPARWNPEELLVASLSACHQLWYLSLCAHAGVAVLEYEDRAEGEMTETPDGAGAFTAATLRPRVTIAADSDEGTALALHEKAHAMCFIARSVAFPVHHAPTIVRRGA